MLSQQALERCLRYDSWPGLAAVLIYLRSVSFFHSCVVFVSTLSQRLIWLLGLVSIQLG